MFKGPVLVVVFAVIVVFCASASTLATEDPELNQCKHQCRHQRQYDESQREHCERQCEEYIREKHQRQRGERGGSEEVMEEEEEEDWRLVVNPIDPDEEYTRCRERCQHGEEGRRVQQECESRCEQQRREQERRRRGRNQRREQEEEEEEEEEEMEGGEGGEARNPFVFQEGHFRTIARTQHGKIRVLPKFTERSKNLFKGIENYRVEIFEAAPQTFMVPKHCDADYILFVCHGRGKVTLVHKDRRQSFNVERGHIMKIPAGVTVYSINNDNNERLIIVKLIIPVSTPGNFESFYGAAGLNPESFFKAFSSEILEAALKVPRYQFERIFERQTDGAIIKASREQIQALSGDEEGGSSSIREGIKWPFGDQGKSKEEEGPFNLFKQRPTHTNQYGNLREVKPDDCESLKKLNMAISFANITQGSMLAPLFNSRSTKISVVVGGRGYFEMACPHMGSSGSREGRHDRRSQERERQTGSEGSSPVRYEKVSSELRCGTVFIVPAGHPYVTVASQNENLEVICFELNAKDNHRVPIAGKNNIFKNLEREAAALAFKAKPEEVMRVFDNQREDFFVPGPRRQMEGRADA